MNDWAAVYQTHTICLAGQLSSAGVKKQGSAHVGGDFESDVCDEIERKSSIVGWRRDMQVLESN